MGPVRGFALKFLLGEMAGPLLLGGQRVVPKKLLDAGYKFEFPNLAPELESIFTT